MKNVIVTTATNWVSEEVREGLNPDGFRVVKDYGFDIPFPAQDIHAWWLPAAHATKVFLSLPDIHFTAPGSEWLERIPLELTGRFINSLTLGDLLDWRFPGRLWMKPSEAKLDMLPAAFYDFSQLSSIANTYGLSREMNMQWTSSFIPFNWEHRFYVVGGVVITGSPYLVDGSTYNDGVSWDKYEEAMAYAQTAVDLIDDYQPHSYVLDVGLNEENGEWLVVEANPTWCSGFYGSNIEKVIEAIHESMKPCNGWDWKPDAELIRTNTKKKKLGICPPVNLR